MMRLTSVVLPAPVGPTMATVWPGSTWKSTSSISGVARVDMEAHVFDQRLVLVVAEGDVFEGHAALRHRRSPRDSVLGGLLLSVEQLEDPFRPGNPRLGSAYHRGGVGDRLAEL